jgi:hypothetical protein
MEASGEAFGADEQILVSPDPETLAPRPEFEGVNSCRAAMLCALLAPDQAAISGLEAELEELGLPVDIAREGFRTGDTEGLPPDLDFRRVTLSGFEGRLGLWRRLAETGEPALAIEFLVELLAGPMERESAAAAAALWRAGISEGDSRLVRLRWRKRWPLAKSRRVLEEDALWPFDVPFDFGPEESRWDWERWSGFFREATGELRSSEDPVLFLAWLTRLRLRVAMRSRDSVTRAFARAAFVPRGDQGNEGGGSPPAQPPTPRSDVSTMVHGTFGWRGDWWRPDGEFHEFILGGPRPNLYNKGARFSWSGAYRAGDREIAGKDLRDWSAECAPSGLQSLFAHSYGGEIAARAVTEGVSVDELVLLSSPANSEVRAAIGSVRRVIDVRLNFDPVLALARERQRLPDAANVTPFLLGWRLGHGASHNAEIWRRRDIANRVGL